MGQHLDHGLPSLQNSEKKLTLFKLPSQWLSEEALQIAVKRREAKSKGEKERYTHLNAEEIRKSSLVINAFECRGDKKVFLGDQCI